MTLNGEVPLGSDTALSQEGWCPEMTVQKAPRSLPAGLLVLRTAPVDRLSPFPVGEPSRQRTADLACGRDREPIASKGTSNG